MTLARIAMTAGAVILSATIVPFALPRHISVERSATVAASPQDVLALAGSNAGYQQFNPYSEADPALQISLFGPEDGVGSGFHFKGKDGEGTQTVAQLSESEVVFDIDLGAFGQPKQSITATPTAEGTLVTWRMQSDAGFNPVFRVFGLFMDGMMGPVFERGLENIGKATA